MSKIAIVFGANGAIGSATITELLKNGYHVVPVVRADNCHKKSCTCEKLDFKSPNLINEFCNKIGAKFNEIQLVVNATGTAGHNWSQINPLLWQETITVNAISPMIIAHELLKYMKPGGCIINISSTAANLAFREPDYSSSKAALEAATKSFAWVAAKFNVRALCVSPGPVASSMTSGWTSEELKDRLNRTPLNRLASPKDIAELITFLASPKAQHITGCAVAINGGFEMR